MLSIWVNFSIRHFVVLSRQIFLVLVAAAMILPYYSSYVESIGGSLLDGGVGAGVFAVFAAVASLIAGIYADGIKKKPSFGPSDIWEWR